MKYRSDFVTNSSSSSYIIAYQQTPNYDEETLKKYPALACFNRLIDMVLTASGEYSDTDDGHKVTTKDELDRYFTDYYMYGEQTLDDFFQEEKWCRKNMISVWMQSRLGALSFLKASTIQIQSFLTLSTSSGSTIPV